MELDAKIGARAAVRALELCKDLSRTWKPAQGNARRSNIVYLADLGVMIITERIVRYQPKKYRGTQKFSNAFRVDILGVGEREVGRAGL